VRGRWETRLLGLVLAVYAGLSLAYNVSFPIWEGPEEAAHVEYVRYIQENRTLAVVQPGPSPPTPPSAPGTEFSQTPLYYVVLAVALGRIQLPPDAQWHRNPYVTWTDHPYRNAYALHRADEGWPYHGLALFVHLGRLLAMAFGLLTLRATYALVSRLLGRPTVGLFAAAWLALTPGFVLATNRFNNDAAAFGWSALTLLASLHLLLEPDYFPTRLLLGASLGLTFALLSKLDTVFLVPLVGAAAILSIRPAVSAVVTWARRGAATLLALGPPFVVVGGWWLAYGRTFSGGLGQQVGVGVLSAWNLIGELTWGKVIESLWWLNTSWWDRPGFSLDVGWPTIGYALVTAPAIVLIVSGIWALADRSYWLTAPKRARLAAVLLSASILPIAYATIAREVFPSIGLDANARFLLPAAPAVVLVAALGGARLPLGRWGPPLAATYLIGLLGLCVATPLVLFPQMNVPYIPARLARDQAEAARPAVAAFANGVELVGVDGLPSTLRLGRSLALNLQWRVARPPRADFVVYVHLVDSGGTRLAGYDTIPLESVFPPRLWDRGELVDQPMLIPVPAELRPGVYSVQIGMYRHEGDSLTQISLTCPCDHTDTVSVGGWKILPALPEPSHQRRLDARFGDDLALRGFSVQSDPSGLRVGLRWEALQPMSRHLVVSVQILDGGGNLVAQNDGEPVDGRLPTTTWSTGEAIWDDHLVGISGSRAGQRIAVVVYDRQTGQRLPVVSDTPTSDQLLFLPMD
jgi:hypothetical protein